MNRPDEKETLHLWSYLVIKVATENGPLNLGLRSTMLIIPCDQTKDHRENKNEAKKRYDRKVSVDEGRKTSIVKGKNPLHTRNPR